MSQSPSSPAEHPGPAHRKLRIAVFNRTFSPTGGGAERYSIALVEQLSARHEIVTVVLVHNSLRAGGDVP